MKQNQSHLIAPSILAADFARIKEEVEMLNKSECDWIHIDIMDGHFVPNISFGFPVLKAIKKYAKKPLDVHLMIVEPDKYLEDFKKAGADVLTVHLEACTHLHRTIYGIKNMGIKAGVAINPHTPVALLEPVVKDIDLVCLMSVNPGFGGQSFIPYTLQKIIQLAQLRQPSSLPLIEIDGGVTMDNAAQILQAGADVLVAGSTVFKSTQPEQTILELKDINVGQVFM